MAAKLYKAREFRSFKNDAGYLEGRTVRNSRTQRAMDKGSKFGREASEEAWKSAEADALFSLHAAGVRVPKPVLFFDGVLLMEAIGDAEGRVAPRLIDAGITKEEAGPLYLQVRADVIKMLSLDLIHGDLSPFNILMAKSGPVIIDFPQVVTAAKNSRSEQFFRRDLGNLQTFFASIDPALSRYAGDADEIWREYVRRDLSASFVPSGRVPQARSGPPGRFNPNPNRDRHGLPQATGEKGNGGAARANNGGQRPNENGWQRTNGGGQRQDAGANHGGQRRNNDAAPNAGQRRNGDTGGQRHGGVPNGQRPNNGANDGGQRQNASAAPNGQRSNTGAANDGGQWRNGDTGGQRPNNHGGAPNGQRPNGAANNGGQRRNDERQNSGQRPNNAAPNTGGQRPNTGGAPTGGGQRQNNGGRPQGQPPRDQNRGNQKPGPQVAFKSTPGGGNGAGGGQASAKRHQHPRANNGRSHGS